MRRLLQRVVVRVVVTTLLIVLVPLSAFLLWWSSRLSGHAGLFVSTITPMHAFVAVVVVALFTGALALSLGHLQVRRVAALVLPVLDRLVKESERLDESVRPEPQPATGVEELDRLSAALDRGAARASQRLAAERDFSADASHQLRTPLTALLMRLEEIAATDDLAVVAEESQIAIAQVERLSRVVDDLLARSRSGEDATPTVSLDSVLASLQREWQPSFESARRTVHVTGERGLRVHAAPGPLSQIISTLFENSLSHGSGIVTVSARRAGTSVIVEVSDEGEGVSAALAPHIFERSVSSKGSGLGLALARDLAAAQGGRLELVEARGAVFALFLSEAVN